MSQVALYGGDDQPKPMLRQGKQLIGISNIEWLEELQPRSGIAPDWGNDLSKFVADQQEPERAFPPAKIVQFSDGRLIATEAHHRRYALLSLGRSQMLCEVVNGTMEDAIVLAAGSNKNNGVKPMGDKEITKAVEMLFLVDEWWEKSDTLVGEYVGCATSKVGRIRKIVIQSGKRKAPTYVNGLGKKIPYNRGHGKNPRRISETRKGNYQATFEGKRLNGSTAEAVAAKLQDAEESLKHKRNSLSYVATKTNLYKHGFSGAIPFGAAYHGLRGIYGFGLVCMPCDFSEPESLPLVVGQLIASKQIVDHSGRMVVICYPEDGPSAVIDLYRAAGFEFMTPDELIESLKSE